MEKTPEKPKKLSNGELEVMQEVWKAKGPVTSGDILKGIGGRRSWALSTLMTVLGRLEGKGYLFCDRSTRVNLYSALVEERTYQEQEGSSFFRRMYGGSLPGLISCLYRGGAISDRDLDELRDFLEQKWKEGE